MTPQSLAALTLIGATSVWGLYWLPLEWLESQGMSGIFTVAILNIAPAVMLLLWSWRTRGHRPEFHRALWVGAIAGLGFGLYSAGIVYGSVVRATLLFYLTPIWSTLIGMIWLGERITWQRWAAIVVGLAGVGLLIGNSAQASLGIGDVFALASGLAWAVGAALIKRDPSMPLTGLTGAQFATTSLLAVIIALVFGAPLPSATIIVISLPWAALISLMVFTPSILAIFWAQKQVSPGRAGLLMMSEVVVAILSAAILLPHEHLNSLQWIGAGLILSTFLLELTDKSQPVVFQPA